MHVPLPPANYTITDLGTLGGATANAASINNYGQVVGEADFGNGERRAFLWENGVMVEIAQHLGGPWTSAQDINHFGQIVIMNGSSNCQFWDNGELTRILGLNPGGSADLGALNDLGQVVGGSYEYVSGGYHAFLWENGKIIDLTATIGIGGSRDINNSSHVACAAEFDGVTRAAIWTGQEFLETGDLGGSYSYASGLNDRGQVVGGSERPPGGDEEFHEFLWDGYVAVDIAAVSGKKIHSWTQSTLNNCGEVLVPGDFDHAASFYRFGSDGALAPVRGATPPYAEWHNLTPRKMNDYSEIVGYGVLGDLTRAFFLRPLDGDINVDGYFDLADFSLLQNAFTGSLPPTVPGCTRADGDRDGDVDLWDWNDLLIHFTVTNKQLD